MRAAHALLAGHVTLMAFGLAGMLIALPRPELWAGSASAELVFTFGMRWGGAAQIALGAGAVFAFGVAVLGWRRTATFCAVSVGVSLAVELIGTTTGWPFGPYVYTEVLGPKVLGHVPFAIPLSWFSLGFTSYLLAHLALARLAPRVAGWAAVALGAALLVVWDLVLDPAMAHPEMPLRFWLWDADGHYFGMPLQNFGGWWLTGVAFMILSRALWGTDIEARRIPAGFPLAVYAANLAFAAVLNASVGLWGPIGIALVLGLGPIALIGLRHPVPRLASRAA